MQYLRQSYARWRSDGFVAVLRDFGPRVMLHLHRYAWDNRFLARETVPTKGFVDKVDLNPVASENLNVAHGYVPSPRLVVHWLLNGLSEDLSIFSFIDFGSGRGRVLLAAAEHPFRAVRGVEFSKPLHDDAIRTIAQYPNERLACRDIKSVCADAGTYTLPEGDCVIYFYNPFGGHLVDRVVRNAIETARTRGNRLIVVYFNPVYDSVLRKNEDLRPRRLTFSARQKVRFLSPYRATVYEMR